MSKTYEHQNDWKYEDRARGVGDMATESERTWTAHIVISCEHAGLRPHFQELEYEIRHVLARVDDPRKVEDYVNFLSEQSQSYFTLFCKRNSRK
jgi:hypothetical protein